MRTVKNGFRRITAMVCALALCASMLSTAVFAAEPEATPTPEPTPIVETTPEPSGSPVNTDATVTTPAPDTGTGSTSAPEETPAGNTDDIKEPVESPEPSGEPTDAATESGEKNVENTESPDESEKQPASTPVMLSAEAATANTPQARAVGYIYENSEKGISITFNAQGSRTHHFVITENGTLLWEGDVSGFQAGANSVTIIAPGYEVSTSVHWEGIIAQGTFTHDDTGDNYTLLPYYDNVTARIELSSFKTFDDVQIVNSGDGTNYGTFSWLKGDADNDDFPRTLMIVVDGETVHSQMVYTPNHLDNVLGQPDQYWFTPSSGFKYEYEMSPSDWMDSNTRKDLTINLTSECPCGNDLCTCPGGAECDCEQGCVCEYCKPTDEDRTIRTTYGTISYKKPSAEGYNLTVETYVNGTLVDTQKNLRIRASENDSLAYTPASGYYYYNDQNSYDIITRNDGSWWDQRTGHILIVGTDEASRNYDNVLKVYLWTFNNHLTLDVNRIVGGPLDRVTGYTISFEAPDPSNPNTTKTYTYEATSFAGAQQQMIPFATWVTITPICEKGYEVAQWSTASQYSGVSLRGSEGNVRSKAYGNSAGLFADGTARDSLLLYIDSVRTVEPPTDDELIDNEPDDNPDAPYFDGNVEVVVDCVKADAEHEDSTYGLIQGTFEVSELKGRSDTGYYVEVTIKDPQAYVDRYNLNVQGHKRSDSEDVVITLRWVVENHESVWKADGPATIKVTCEDTTKESVALEKTILSVKRGDETLTGNNIPATLKVGDEITYQINVTNTGDVNLEGLTVTDAFTGNNKPSEGDGITWIGAAGNWTGTISNIELPAGEAKTYKYTCTVAEVDKGKTISNKATINGDDSEEPIDEDEIKTEVENPAVGVKKNLVQVKRGEEIFLAEKGTIPEELEVGDELTYEIEVENIGNVKLKGLTLTDTFNGHFAPSKVKDKVANVELTNEWEKDTTTGLWTLKIENISPDVGEIKTYTYTYIVNQADAGNTLTNTAVVTGDELDQENPPEDKDEHKVTNDGDITLQPADITIYMGGKDGYAGAAGGDSNSLPEPGFYIKLPGEVEKALQDAGYPNGEAADLSKIITGVTATTADGQTRSWTMKKYGATQSTAWIDDTSQAHFVYRIVPNQGQDPISVNFTDGDGKSVTEDKFTLTDSLSETYFMSLNTAGVDVETISLTFNIKDQIFHCGYDAKNSQKGTLTVRYTTTPDAPTTPAAQSGEDLQANIEANPDSYYVQVAGSDQKFYINEQDTGVDGVDVTAKDVSLLADNIVSDQANAEAASAMVQKAFEAANFGESTAWSKYLDLVDAENGNAWLTPEDGTEVTVFWPYPEGVTKDSEIKLYHFEGLDRDMATGEQLLAQVALTEAKLVPIIEKYEDGFTFNTSSFSPFVLVQNTTQPSGGEDKPSGGDDGNNDNNNNNTNTNNQTTTVNVANQAAAPAAAPAAVSVPQTSDNSQPLVWIALVGISGAALAALAVFRRKRSDK